MCETTAVCVEKDYDGDGGGEGLTGGGPGSCNCEGGTSDQLCDTPYPISPSSDTIIVRDDKRCGGDPLKDMEIRATGCRRKGTRSVEGGRFEGREGGDHDGIDLLNDIGDPVKAAEGGSIWASGKATSGYGYYVIVKTAEKEFHYYTHLKKGSQISEHPPGEDSGIRSIDAGTIVGKTDTTGNASADPCDGGPPHLHYEVRTGATTWGEATPVNPEDHLGTKFNDKGEPVQDSC